MIFDEYNLDFSKYGETTIFAINVSDGKKFIIPAFEDDEFI